LNPGVLEIKLGRLLDVKNTLHGFKIRDDSNTCYLFSRSCDNSRYRFIGKVQSNESVENYCRSFE